MSIAACCAVVAAAARGTSTATAVLQLLPAAMLCTCCTSVVHGSVHAVVFRACRNDVVAMHGALSDYLIKVVPSWIKFAVAGPGQSTNVYNEQTIYTTPEHLMPLIRCAWHHK